MTVIKSIFENDAQNSFQTTTFEIFLTETHKDPRTESHTGQDLTENVRLIMVNCNRKMHYVPTYRRHNGCMHW